MSLTHTLFTADYAKQQQQVAKAAREVAQRIRSLRLRERFLEEDRRLGRPASRGQLRWYQTQVQDARRRLSIDRFLLRARQAQGRQLGLCFDRQGNIKQQVESATAAPASL